MLAVDASGDPAIVGLDAKTAVRTPSAASCLCVRVCVCIKLKGSPQGEFRNPREDDQEIVEAFSGSSGKWKSVTAGALLP